MRTIGIGMWLTLSLLPLTGTDLVATPVLVACLVALSRIDLRTGRLPDAGTLPLVALGLALAVLRGGGTVPGPELAGAIAGYLVFAVVGDLFWRLRGRDGLGRGDAKLMAAGGAWVGIGLVPLAVLIAAGAALVVVVATGRDRAAPLAFGPWLAAGIVVAWTVRLSG